MLAAHCSSESNKVTHSIQGIQGVCVHRDYRANDILDAYEAEGIDEALDLEDMTLEEQLDAKARAERELNKRDRRAGRRDLPGALEGQSRSTHSKHVHNHCLDLFDHAVLANLAHL